MDISAHAFSLRDRPRTGQVGHQGSHAPERPAFHLVSSYRRPRRQTGIGDYVIAVSLSLQFLPPSRPAHPGALRAGAVKAPRGRFAAQPTSRLYGPRGPLSLGVESARVQVFGRRRGRANHTARRPASEKRQGTKSRKWGTRPCREPLWGFGDEPSHEEPRLRSLACSAFIKACVFRCRRKGGEQIGQEVGGIVGEQAEHPP